MVLRRGPGTCKSFLQQPRRSTISNRRGDFFQETLNFLRKGRGGGKKVKEGQAGVNCELDLGVVAAPGRTGSGGMLYGTIHGAIPFLVRNGPADGVSRKKWAEGRL